MHKKAKILSYVNGNPESKVLFIAEAPGRLGADRTGLPLFGDKTGDNFDALLKVIGWSRDDIFITNALLCNPISEKGTNVTPTVGEMKNCSYYLEMTISLINPDVIVTLGRTALEALKLISPHKISLSEHVAKHFDWDSYKLLPLYHPGPRALVHRSFSKQTADFISLFHFVDPMKGLKKVIRRASSGLKKSTQRQENDANILQVLIYMLVNRLGNVSYFKLNKLLYLIDYNAIKQFGQSITNQVYLRQQEGPWIPRFRDQLTVMDGHEITLRFFEGNPYVLSGPAPRLHNPLSHKYENLINDIIEKYGRLNDFQLKSVVYLSAPMKYILRQERKGLKKMNTPVIYQNRTAEELDKSLSDQI